MQLDGVENPVSAKLGEDSPDKAALTSKENQTGTEHVDTIPLTRVVYINPLPEETHSGVNSQTQFSVRGGFDYVTIRHIDTGNENYPSLGWGMSGRP